MASNLAARVLAVESSAVRDILKLTQRPEVLSLAGGLPAAELFDVAGLADAFDRVLRGPAGAQSVQYSVSEGDPQLRERLAELARARGIRATGGDVLVTTGSQQALDLLVTTLLDPGETVLVERPCYLAALQLFALSGVRVVSVACDNDGLIPEALAAAVREHRPKLLYTVPTFQNPTGVTMSLERRREIARLAEREGLWVVEDDPYGELRYHGEALPPLTSLGAERVVYVSTLSKILAPGLRLGWILCPPSLREALTVAKQAKDLHTSTVDQRAGAEYLASGVLGPQVERLRDAYRPRLDTMLETLPAVLPQDSRWTRPSGGMFVWVELPPDVDAHSLLPVAVDQGVAFVPGTHFFADKGRRNTLRLSFTTLPPEQLHEALERLGTAVAQHRRGAPRPAVARPPGRRRPIASAPSGRS